MALPGNLPPGLSASVDFQPQAMAYNNGTHVCEVEVDVATGRVAITRYVVVHDCGRMINPLMVEGQVQGAIAHGIGATLYEWMQYDANGQPLTTNYADYLLPTSDVTPRIEIHHMESPSPTNPLGVKGAAESGTIGAPAAIVSAIEDALKDFQRAHHRPADNAAASARAYSPIVLKLRGREFGGAKRDRTADLLNAIQALSQLSYGPTCPDEPTARPSRYPHR